VPAISRRHARLYAGHPRLSCKADEDVDGRDKRAFTPVFNGLCPAMTTSMLKAKRHDGFAIGDDAYETD
jgi:hypothetical protein